MERFRGDIVDSMLLNDDPEENPGVGPQLVTSASTMSRRLESDYRLSQRIACNQADLLAGADLVSLYLLSLEPSWHRFLEKQ